MMSARSIDRDPLTSYLSEVRQVPQLDSVEQSTLARRYQAGDRGAGDALVRATLPLVVKIAREHRSTRIPLADLVQQGNLGLLHALRKFDPGRNVRFTTYAGFWVRAFILRYLVDNHSVVRIGTTHEERRLFFNLGKTENAHAGAGDEELAEVLNSEGGRVAEMRARLYGGDVSLDGRGGDGQAVGPVAVDDAVPIDDELADREERQRRRARIARFARGLRGREAVLFRERWCSEEASSLSDIGRRFGVTRERMRQIEQRMLERLRAALSAP